MGYAAANAPMFIEAFYDACIALKQRHPDFAVPDETMINTILAQHNAGYDLHLLT